jgi:hypothetical protein
MSLEEQQLQMLRRMATLDPPPCFMGGYAEDALLAGTLTRPHEDFDWLLPRRELELRAGVRAGLREELLSGMTDAELEPTVERLTIHPS